MTDTTLKAQISSDMKDAMRSKEKARLGAIRLILSEVKRIEVDERIEVSDERMLGILDKMAKQRRDSITQFTDAGRTELAEKEQFELEIIQSYLPAQLSEQDIEALIKAAIAETGADSMKDMGKLMGVLKPQLQGKADMGQVSKQVKALLG